MFATRVRQGKRDAADVELYLCIYDKPADNPLSKRLRQSHDSPPFIRPPTMETARGSGGPGSGGASNPGGRSGHIRPVAYDEGAEPLTVKQVEDLRIEVPATPHATAVPAE